VDLFEGADEGAIVVVAVFVGEGLPGAEFFQQVVHAGDGDVGMGGLHFFAVGIEAFAQVADFLFLLWGGIWEGERVEATGFVVSRIGLLKSHLLQVNNAHRT
jgi:hypothetical protein